MPVSWHILRNAIQPLLYYMVKAKKKKKNLLGQKKSQPTFPYMVTVFNFLPKFSDVNLNNTPKQYILYPLFSLNEQLIMSKVKAMIH